jgi:putative acetyltransferase
MIIRQAKKSDVEKILKLYREVALGKNGIARQPHEISKKLVRDFVKKSLANGLIFVVENPNNSQELIAEIHCYKHEPLCFKHVLGDLTLVIKSNFQNQGLGRKIFSHLLLQVEKNHRDIARIELFCRQNNLRGLALYESLGFEIEGFLKNRILDADEQLGGDAILAWINPAFLKNDSWKKLTL